MNREDDTTEAARWGSPVRAARSVAAAVGVGLLDLLYPPRCAVCRRLGETDICDPCASGFRVIPPPVCIVCGGSLAGTRAEASSTLTARVERGMACGACAHGGARHFAWARAAGAFEGALREAIHRLKYDGRRRVGRVLGLWARETAGGVARPPRTPDIVAPVPLHWTRARQRGFNQSLLIAQGFVGGSGWRIEPHALRRVRRTRPQVDLDAEERATNVAGAFAVSDPDMVRGKRVLVVDDVLTTMHTVDECARVLVEAGAAAVHVVAVAR